MADENQGLSSNGAIAGTDRVVGQRVHRYGGVDRVTGAQRYLSDITFVDAAHVAFATIPVGCAAIDVIDVTPAVEMPGVIAVVHAHDLPQPVARFGISHQDRPVIATDTVNYHGEPVVAVVAETEDEARAAANAVVINYTELNGVYGLDAALADDARLVQDPSVRPRDDLNSTNVLEQVEYAWGDAESKSDSSHTIVENTYTFPMVTHFPIEPGGIVASPTDDGGVEVRSPVQHPYLLQRTIADVWSIPLSRVRVIAPDPGGGFGGKQTPRYEPLIAFLALKTRRTCRLVLSLEEAFQLMRRSGCRIYARTGFTEAGELTFHEMGVDFVVGAYADVAPRVMTKGSYVGAGPYRIPHVSINARAVLTNTVPSCAFRGFGAPQVGWATESQLDAGARALGLDSLEIRRRNLVEHDEAFIRGDYEARADGRWHESLEKAAELIGWNKPTPAGRGRGIAVGIKPGATTGLSQSLVRLLYDGSAMAYAGTSDMGQGARTLWKQILADELGVDLDLITIISGDTNSVPFDLQTSASRSTVFMGNAVIAACEDIRARVLELYAEATETAESELAHSPGRLVTPSGAISLVEAAQTALGGLRGEFVGQGTCRLWGEKGHPLGGDASFYEFNATAIEVEVDRATGEILLTKHVTVGDVGTEINPLQVVSQDEGAAIMGLGHSLMEQMLFDDHGRILNLGAIDYRIPTFNDVALDMQTASIENHDGPGPYGCKGISEGALLCTAGAVGAAVADAIGTPVRELPITAERVWRTIRDANRDSPE
ncbi:MAG: xanthine dehydrogenase family protein molybdopterin-binding subunit [Chloroflexi bacterium]|nr:xanthine dehydrogenase family protein molybdopterin-binding subunit [Chloroflexota bacterium]